MEDFTIDGEYGSVIAHYESRFQIIRQNVDDADRKLMECIALAEDGWHGKAGDVTKDKIRELCVEINGISGEMDGVLSQLKLLRNTLDELAIQMLECIPEKGANK